MPARGSPVGGFSEAVVSIVGWAVIIAILLSWQGVGLVKEDWPTLSDMFRAVMRNPLGRWFLFGFWLWVGWHFFIRGWRFFLRES